MRSAARKRGMYTKEIAKALGLSEQRVRETLSVCFPDAIKNGVDMQLTEKQVAAWRQDIDEAENALYQMLRKDGFIDEWNRPYKESVESGLMSERVVYVPQLDVTISQLRITPKGVAYFKELYGGSK